jgi:hypothetical protein
MSFEPTDILELVAELAVAFAGFAGVAGAFKDVAADANQVRSELRILVEYAVLLLANALVPLFLFAMGLGDEIGWRVTSFLSAGLSSTYYVLRFRSLVESMNDENRRTYRLTIAFDWLRILALLANGFAWLPWSPHAVFLALLAYMFFGATTSFLRFMAPLWETNDVEEPS